MSRFTNATTTTTTTASSSLHPPHHSSSAAPPSSFRGGASSGIRSSLKKIPSSLFTGKTRDKFTIHMDDTTATTTTRTTKSHIVPSFLASPPRRDKDKDTSTKLSKTKKPKGARKGLAEIFSWGNSNSSNNNNTAASVPAPPVISPPSALAPSPPRLRKEMPKPLRHSASKVAIPGLSGWTSLRPPAETPARARPSMGADPFSRPSDGAERVDQLSQCGELFERRGSVSSSKALSTKTLDSAEKGSKRGSAGSGSAVSTETHETADKRNSITSSKAISTKTVDSDYTIRSASPFLSPVLPVPVLQADDSGFKDRQRSDELDTCHPSQPGLPW